MIEPPPMPWTKPKPTGLPPKIEPRVIDVMATLLSTGHSFTLDRLVAILERRFPHHDLKELRWLVRRHLRELKVHHRCRDDGETVYWMADADDEVIATSRCRQMFTVPNLENSLNKSRSVA
jgi:hypothetical protein